MKFLDRFLGWALVVASSLHAYGSWKAFQDQPAILVWAWSATLAGWLLASLHLLRAGRPGDRPLAWVGFAGSLAWVVLALSFGKTIGNVFDPRAMIHALIALGLAAMSLRTLSKA